MLNVLGDAGVYFGAEVFFLCVHTDEQLLCPHSAVGDWGVCVCVQTESLSFPARREMKWRNRYLEPHLIQ